MRSAAHTLKTALKRPIQETAEATGNLFSNKTADKVAKVSTSSPDNSQRHLKVRI